MKKLEFYFDLSSPYAYLAHKQLTALQQKYKVDVVWRPMLLGGVFKATNNKPPISVPAKGRYLHHDLQRSAKQLNIKFQISPHFPINSLPLMRGAMVLQATQPEKFMPYINAMFDAIFADGKPMGEQAAIAEVLAELGIDAQQFAADIATPENKQLLIEATDKALELGIFGAPSFIIDGEMYWGADRLASIEKLLTPA